jgi:hypothetical protein
MYIYINHHRLWRELLKKYFLDEYAKRYLQMPNDMAFFSIFMAYYRLASLEQKKQILIDIQTSDLICSAVTFDCLGYFLCIYPTYQVLAWTGSKVVSVLPACPITKKVFTILFEILF